MKTSNNCKTAVRDQEHCAAQKQRDCKTAVRDQDHLAAQKQREAVELQQDITKMKSELDDKEGHKCIRFMIS